MARIGGNTTGLLQVKSAISYNAIGEKELSWNTTNTLTGWLDMQSQLANRNTYYTKLEESTHIFMCDYVELDRTVENKRMLINNEVYDVLYIDDPMNLHQHLEIFLKYIGGQDANNIQ